MTTTLTSTVEFNADLLRKYNQPLPRYTMLSPGDGDEKRRFHGDALRSAIAAGNYKKNAPLPLLLPHSLFATAPATSAAATPSLLAIRMWPILTTSTT